MRTVKAFVKSHPVLAYYLLVFTISWGGILIVVSPSGIPGTPEEFQRLLPIVLLALLGGPSAACVLLTAFIYGRAGLAELLSRLVKWRVRVRWYAVALLTAPLLLMVIPLALSLIFSEFIPRIFVADDKTSLFVMGIGAGIMGGFLEELGWTGFAIPRLRMRYGVLTTGIIVGFLWGAWHILMNFWTSGKSSGALDPTLFLHSFIFSVGILPAFRVLMVWNYNRTGSLMVAMLMHLSLIIANVLFVPVEIAGIPGVIWSLVITAVLWIVVAAVVLANGGQLSLDPLRRRVV
jgi:membrane protease YdiL (CAAX protease family)